MPTPDALQAIVGSSNMNAAAKDNVISILAAAPLPPTTRRYLYARWAKAVGVQLDAADTDRVAPVPAR